MKEIIHKLIDLNKTISTMESCTGGYIANAITNIEDASKVLKFSAVTYSNTFKIKMGVEKELIDKYSVYSMEVARSMAKAISNYASSNYGVGITGKLNKADASNRYGKDNEVFVCIYDWDNDKYYEQKMEVTGKTREENKKQVLDSITCLLKKIII